MGYFLLLNLWEAISALTTNHVGAGKAILAGLILFSLIRKNRIAWQYSRLICLVTAVLVPLWMANKMMEGNAPTIGIVLLIPLVSGPALAVALSLGRPSARSYFGLACPQCGSIKTKAGDLFFKKIKCKTCGHLWTGNRMGFN
jgi:hypothetical protein